jgi:transcription antitermination factor NusG
VSAQVLACYKAVENLLRARDGEALSTLLNGNLAQGLTCKIDPDRNWYAVYTSSCHEKQVAEHLKVREIVHFLPLYSSVRRWNSGRIVTRECPLFPSYIFVQGACEDRGRIVSVPGVLSIVGTSRAATPLPESEIEILRYGLHLHNAEPHPFLKVGEKARICSGSLAGMEGVVLRHKNSTRLVLTLDLIMQSVAVEVAAADLEPLQFTSKYVS